MTGLVQDHAHTEKQGSIHLHILTGGTQPADHVHPKVVTVMEELGIDLSENMPRDITVGEVQASEYVITMGCSAQDVCPATWSGDNRDWGLDDPNGKPMEEVRVTR